MLPLAHLNVKFSLDGENYDVEHFDINFEQPTDFRGQPQHEIGGGQMTVHISQIPSDNLYLWAKTSTSRKSGILLFQTDLGMTVLTVEFTNAYCINLTRKINAYTGTNTILVISPDKVKINDIEHDNDWAK
jgi:hypothetical protein